MADDSKYDEIYELFLATLAITRQTLIINGVDESDIYFGLIAKHYDIVLNTLLGMNGMNIGNNMGMNISNNVGNNSMDNSVDVFKPYQKMMLYACADDFRIHVNYIHQCVLARSNNADCRTYYIESVERLDRMRNPII